MSRIVGTALFALAVSSAALGSEAPKGRNFSFVLENDVFYNNDKDYTNGIAFIWVPTEQSTPDWAMAIARWLPWFPAERHVRHGYALGQNMYTPSDISLADPPRTDRPYAGWLYGTIGLGIAAEGQLDQLALSLGVVGPASLAEQTQKFVHRITGSTEPRGWDTQLGNEPGVVLTYQRNWQNIASAAPTGVDFDVMTHVGGALGNVYTYANAGLTFRYGRNLRFDYGPPRIQPSPPGSSLFAPTDRFAWYLFVGVEGRAVARNIFLDGNTFRDSRSVDKEPFVGDLHLGIVVTWRDVRLAYTHVRLTREFEGQVGRSQFGGVSLSIMF